jgi:hypothetical protein
VAAFRQLEHARTRHVLLEMDGEAMGRLVLVATTSIGSPIFASSAVRSKNGTRAPCTPRMVMAWPLAEPSANCRLNSAQPRGSLVR